MSGAITDAAVRESADEQVLREITDRLERRLDDLVAMSVSAIFEEIPAYRAHANPRLERGVRQHVREHFVATLATFRTRKPVTPEDLMFIRRHAAQRQGQLSVADFIHAFQAGQRILWDATLALADDDATRRAVLSLVGHITSYFEVALTHAAEVYLEAEQLLGAAGERLRRDTLEDLLAGTSITPGPRLQTLRESGLEAESDCVVITAVPVTALEDVHALRGAAGALTRVPRLAVSPLAVVRHDEIVIVAPAHTGEILGLVERLRATQERLAERALALGVGMSTVHSGLASIPAAYQEALEARALLEGRAGVVALPAMSAFDYVMHHRSATARRLIPADVARFVAEDAAERGVLVATLRAYVAADLNVKRTAEQLHIHVNTAHYRLAKIEERTGVDLRHVRDVVELLIAAEVVAPSVGSRG